MVVQASISRTNLERNYLTLFQFFFIFTIRFVIAWNPISRPLALYWSGSLQSVPNAFQRFHPRDDYTGLRPTGLVWLAAYPIIGSGFGIGIFEG